MSKRVILSCVARIRLADLSNCLTSFSRARSFNQPIGNWSTGNVEIMHNMFRGAASFNQDLKFDTSNVVDMSQMFLGASSMNGDISQLDTSNVFAMEGMFRNIDYNPDISMWDVSSLVVATQMYVSLGICHTFLLTLILSPRDSIDDKLGLTTIRHSIQQSLTGIQNH